MAEQRQQIAEAEIRSVIDETFPAAYHPDDVRAGQRVISSGDATGTDYVYGFNWQFSSERNETTFWVGVYFHPNKSKDPTTVHEVIWTVEGTAERNVSALNEHTARILISDYVLFEPRGLDCELVTNDTLGCDSYWREQETEYGVVIPYLEHASIGGAFQILGCKRTADSPRFGTGSCAWQVNASQSGAIS